MRSVKQLNSMSNHIQSSSDLTCTITLCNTRSRDKHFEVVGYFENGYIIQETRLLLRTFSNAM